MVIRRLEKTDIRSAFASGDEHLDRFFRQQARQAQDRHQSATYVAVDHDEVIRGFATVVAAEITPIKLPEQVRKKLPRYPLPVLRLARMAVARTHQGQGIGKQLLAHVFGLAHEQAELSGCVGVVVDAKPDAISFYKPFGFEELILVEGELPAEAISTSMYLEIGAIPRS